MTVGDFVLITWKTSRVNEDEAYLVIGNNNGLIYILDHHERFDLVNDYPWFKAGISPRFLNSSHVRLYEEDLVKISPTCPKTSTARQYLKNISGESA